MATVALDRSDCLMVRERKALSILSRIASFSPSLLACTDLNNRESILQINSNCV